MWWAGGGQWWWLRAGGDYWIIVRAWWPWCPWWAWCERGVPGQSVRGWAIAKSFPRSPASADFRQHPKTAFSDVGCARTAETDCDGLLGQLRMKPAEPTLAAMQGVSACSKALEALDSHATRQRNAAKNPNPLTRGERERLAATRDPRQLRLSVQKSPHITILSCRPQ